MVALSTELSDVHISILDNASFYKIILHVMHDIKVLNIHKYWATYILGIYQIYDKLP